MNAKTILVPVDFSDVTPRVAEVASSVAAAFEGELILLHVQEPPPDFVGFEPGPLPVTLAATSTTREVHQQMEDLRVLLSKTGVPVAARELGGPIIHRILDQANLLGANLIVMGSHGHGALYNLFVGSVTSGVMKDARCPVLVVPSRKRP